MPFYPIEVHSFADNVDTGDPGTATLINATYMTERDEEIEAIENVLGEDLAPVPGSGKPLSARVRVVSGDVLNVGVIDEPSVSSAGEQLRIGPEECGHSRLTLAKNSDAGPMRVQCYSMSQSAVDGVQNLVLQPEGGSVIIRGGTNTIAPLMMQETTSAGASFENTGNGAVTINLDAARANPNNALGRIRGRWANNHVAEIAFRGGDDSGAKDAGEITFSTSNGNSNPVERVRIAQEGGIFMSAGSHPDDIDRSNSAAIYCRDKDGYAEVWVIDEQKNYTQISPHDAVTGEWVFRSGNLNTGRTVDVKMEKLVRTVEGLTGRTFLVEGHVDDEDYDDRRPTPDTP